MKKQNSLNKDIVNIRAYALDILIEILEKGAYSDKALHSVLDSGVIPDRRDRAFLSKLCTGTVERVITADYIINCFTEIKTGKMKPAIRNILRMSVYQVFYMEQVPQSAICNEAVKLASAHGLKGLKGFVNGVLRNIIRNKDNIKYPLREDGFIPYISIKYSVPEWIVKKTCSVYGEEITEKISDTFINGEKYTTLRCNISKSGVSGITALLKAENKDINIKSGRFFGYALRIKNYNSISSLDAFKKGLIQVQDESSMLPAAVARIKEGNTVIDICASPGGKTLHAADILHGTGRIISCDISSNKTKLIYDNIKRTGFKNIEVHENDARVYKKEWKGIADIVIADLPCSGLGVSGRKCDIKYKTKPGDIETLAALQREILSVVADYVKPGGRLVYSTCTITVEENIKNFHWVLENLPFCSEDIEGLLPECLKEKTGHNGYIQVLPYMAGTDGFFVASFIKKTGR